MGIFFIEASLSFLMKWNSIKVFYPSVSLAPQADTLFEKFKIPSSTLGYKFFEPQVLSSNLLQQRECVPTFQKNLKNMT
jgi:hypothetical protein